MEIFEKVNVEILRLVSLWEPELSSLGEEKITLRLNRQGRSIKQITGHMVDSASNNIHRIVHLQYGVEPLVFPDYSFNGNNDRWIAIQDYQNEPWQDLVQLWKYSNLHLVHVIRNVGSSCLGRRWLAGDGTPVLLEAMINDYPRHLRLHLGQIEDLLKES